MKKGSTWFILLGIICALYGICSRYRIEKADRTVELVVDGDALRSYATENSYQIETMLKELLDIGIGAFAVPEIDLAEAASYKEVTVIPGTYLLLSNIENLPSIDPRKLYILDQPLGPVSQRMGLLGQSFILEDNLLWEFSEAYPVLITRRKEASREPTTSVWDEALHPDYDLLQTANDTNFRIISRIQNPFFNNQTNLSYVLSQWQGKQNLIIFAGKEVLGYPDNITEVALMIKDKTWGLIEFANQYGEKDLARLTNYNVVRVHSITPQEIKKIDPLKAHERYLRAVRERGARVIYFRPFPKLSWQENLTSFKSLKEDLVQEGFQIGAAIPKPFFKSSFLVFWPVVLGIVICGIELMLLLGFNKSFSLYTGITFLLLITGLYFKGYTVLARQIASFGAAVVFPALAIGKVAQNINKGNNRLLCQLLTVFGYTIIGVLFITASLLDLRFIIKVDQFLGVKLMHILPPLLSLWICIRLLGFTWSKKKLMSFFYPVTWSHVLIIVLILGAGFIYIGRTGHDWGLPVPKAEENLRIFLEKVFLIRPRLKEAFIGHPVLVLALIIAALTPSVWYLPYLLAVGSIGITSVLNTFSHAHTPLLVSLIRTGWGFLIGAVIGVLVFYLLKLTARKIMRG